MKRILIFFSLFLVILSCTNNSSVVSDHQADSPKEAQMRAMGLVDIHDLDSTIAVDLIYAKPYNFMGKVLYKDVNKAFMLPETAEKLLKANKLLKSIRLDLNLIVYDAARPISIQQEMWDSVEGTDMEDFVANPARGGGNHNFGNAVDVTIIDCTGHPIPMGSEYDCFADQSRVNIEQQLLDEGKITKRELENRLLLRKVMTEAGFLPIDEEWWHFDHMPTKYARENFKLIP
ncbi:MAG: D-alanyl-D-alanine dipeptidase [Bacteroidales bacterium]|nr:D-alanyl-D-alanine dipeptidase [Bacteroidales bacterium]